MAHPDSRNHIRSSGDGFGGESCRDVSVFLLRKNAFKTCVARYCQLAVEHQMEDDMNWMAGDVTFVVGTL
jgi:hypothetical protein